MKNTKTTPQPIEIDHQTSDSAGLGALIQNFPVKNRSRNFWLRFILGCCLLLFSLGVALWGIWLSWISVVAHGRAVLLRTLSLPLILVLASLISGAVLIFYAWLHRCDGISLYHNGFHLRQGSRQITWAWESVDSLSTVIEHIKFATSVIDVRARLMIAQQEGATIILRNRYTDMPALIQTIHSQVVPRLHQKIVQRLGQGETLNFHPHLLASSQGLQINQTQFGWNSLPESLVKNRTLILKDIQSGRYIFKANIRKINNLDLLLTLLESPPLNR